MKQEYQRSQKPVKSFFHKEPEQGKNEYTVGYMKQKVRKVITCGSHAPQLVFDKIYQAVQRPDHVGIRLKQEFYYVARYQILQIRVVEYIGRIINRNMAVCCNNTKDQEPHHDKYCLIFYLFYERFHVLKAGTRFIPSINSQSNHAHISRVSLFSDKIKRNV
jgi:hypothetical protein